MLSTHNYEENYSNLPFEDVLREFRKKTVWRVFSNWQHGSILEIGSGPKPLFTEFDDFHSMVVIEPGDAYFREANQLALNDPRIEVYHNFFENIYDQLIGRRFDIIVVGGFLHEIDNPGLFVTQLKSVCNPKSIIHTFVPNAQSFHRLLALEMGLINTIYEPSHNDNVFQRRTIFDMDRFRQLFTSNGYEVLAEGSYFIKPFTHIQMDGLLKSGLFNDSLLSGLNGMVKYMPMLGAEIYVTVRLQSSQS